MCYHTITERLSKTDLDKSNTRTRYCQWEKDCLSGGCTLTIEYPSPEMILAGEVSPRHCNRAVERTKEEIYAAQKKRGRNGYGAWQT